MSFEELEKLWNEFEDVPIDKDECINEDFYIWEKGTDRYHIWHWFDDRLPNALAVDLMGLIRKKALAITSKFWNLKIPKKGVKLPEEKAHVVFLC